MSTAAIYPGSFDPLTNGHADIVQRSLRMFDRVVVAVANNASKKHLFTVEERLEMARAAFGHDERVEFDTFDGLLVDYAARKQISVLIRGLRAVSDFEYEFQIASMNAKLNSSVETTFLMTREENYYLSSSLVREVARFGGDVKNMVPAPVWKKLQERLARDADASGGN